MGGSYSTPAFMSGARYETLPGGKSRLLKVAGWGTRRKCLAGPQRIQDTRGWALTQIYGVPMSQLDMYPSTFYTLDMALADIAACRSGASLPYTRKVVRFDRISRGDPIAFALSRVHGLSPAEVALGRKGLPYTAKMAQIDISSYAKRGKPYYQIRLPGFQVIDLKTGVVRDYRDKGLEEGYKYVYANIDGRGQRIRRLDSPVERRLDLRGGVAKGRYSLKVRGGRPTYEIPCADFPAMCGPGQKTFFHVADDPAEAVATASAAAVSGSARRSAGVNDTARRSRRSRRSARTPAASSSARPGAPPMPRSSGAPPAPSGGGRAQSRASLDLQMRRYVKRQRKEFERTRQARLRDLRARVAAGNSSAQTRAELNRVRAGRYTV